MIRLLLLILCSMSLSAQTVNFENFRSAVKDWLKLDSYYDYAYVGHSDIEANGVALMLDKFLKDKSWVTHHISSYYGSSKTWPKSQAFMKTSQAPHKSELKITSANYFIARGDQKLVLSVSASRFYIYYNEDKTDSYDLALNFKKNYTSYFIANSPYKNKALEFDGSLRYLNGVDELKSKWNNFIFPQDAKNKIKNTIDNFIGKYDRANWDRYKLPHSRGVILYGPPGTGKSFVASVLISNVLKKRYANKVTYIHVQSRNVGSASAIRNIYQMARRYAPSIVFFEDIDLISGTDRTDQAAVKNELMQQLSGLETLKGVLTIGTTNYFDRIDYALKRSKRLGFHFEVGLPTFDSRGKLFKMFLAKSQYQVDPATINFTKLSELSEGMTGADIKEVVDLVVQKSMRVNGNRTEINIAQNTIEQVITNKKTEGFGR